MAFRIDIIILAKHSPSSLFLLFSCFPHPTLLPVNWAEAGRGKYE